MGHPIVVVLSDVGHPARQKLTINRSPGLGFSVEGLYFGLVSEKQIPVPEVFRT
jgi:hypothetical protein